MILSFLFLWQVRDFVYQISYDLQNENKLVNNKNDLDQLLNSFKRLPLDQLPEDYKSISRINSSEYAKMYKGSMFYILSPHDIYKRIVGNTRIKQLLPKDQFYSAAIMNRSKQIYWRIDKNLLYKIFELREELDRQGYDQDAFKIKSGFRTPVFNHQVKGASKSRHIKGEAVDMTVGDINRDGKYSDKDKQILINILEQKIIKDQGGIGKYPGTRTVHMDVRGYRARWDSY